MEGETYTKYKLLNQTIPYEPKLQIFMAFTRREVSNSRFPLNKVFPSLSGPVLNVCLYQIEHKLFTLFVLKTYAQIKFWHLNWSGTEIELKDVFK